MHHILVVVCSAGGLYAMTRDIQAIRFCFRDGQNVTKTEMSHKQKCHQKSNDPKTEMSQKLKFHQN